MKKITFLLAMLLLATTNFAQTILYTQDFEGATIPSGWADQNIGSGSQLWTFGSGVIPEGGTTNDFTTNAAIFDDGSSGNSGNHDERVLWYGPIDISSYVNVTLNYDYALNVLNDGDEELTVRLWDNSVASWITIVTYSTDTDPTTDSIDVSAALLVNSGIDPNNLFFGFGYDDLDSDWAYGAGIDNVELVDGVVEDVIFTHSATAANIVSNYTIIDHPLLNGNSNAIITVSHNWEENSTLNVNTVGVLYNGSNWAVYNEDDTIPMINGAAFNIYITGSGANAYTHIATAANQGANVAYTIIDDASVNGDPNAIIVLSNYYSPNSVYNSGYYGLYYNTTNSKWVIFNEEINAIPTDAAFNVVLAPSGTAVEAIQHQATAANTTQYWTAINNPLLNGHPDAKFVFTHNWGAGGDTSNILVTNTQSIWYEESTERWRIFNDDISNMAVNVKFNILVMSTNTTADIVDNELLSFSIFPNPVKDVLNVQSQETISKVAIYNLIGQEVIVLIPNSSNLEIDLSGLDAGIYVIKVLSNNKEMNKRFIKK